MSEATGLEAKTIHRLLECKPPEGYQKDEENPLEGDVLIVDEILGVGDFRFQKKCQRRIQELMGGGTTVLMVSHTGETIKKFCSRAAWLENGRLREIGPATEVCAHYENQ